MDGESTDGGPGDPLVAAAGRRGIEVEVLDRAAGRRAFSRAGRTVTATGTRPDLPGRDTPASEVDPAAALRALQRSGFPIAGAGSPASSSLRESLRALLVDDVVVAVEALGDDGWHDVTTGLHPDLYGVCRAIGAALDLSVAGIELDVAHRQRTAYVVAGVTDRPAFDGPGAEAAAERWLDLLFPDPVGDEPEPPGHH